MTTVQQWRTALVLIWFSLVALAGLWLVRGATGELAAKLYSDLVGGLVWLAAVQGGKSAVEALAHGKGLRGAARVLLTEERPDDPPKKEGAP